MGSFPYTHGTKVHLSGLYGDQALLCEAADRDGEWPSLGEEPELPLQVLIQLREGREVVRRKEEGADKGTHIRNHSPAQTFGWKVTSKLQVRPAERLPGGLNSTVIKSCSPSEGPSSLHWLTV